MRIESYHEDDSLAATPGWQDGPVSLQRVEGGPARVFANRAAVRADLNRLLDSLRRTGPLNMSKAQHTDTMPHTGLMRPKRF